MIHYLVARSIGRLEASAESNVMVVVSAACSADVLLDPTNTGSLKL